MKLPNAYLALVERNKVVEYLLNKAHPDNLGKARWFESLGFSAADPQPLIAALASVAARGNLVSVEKSPHGDKFVVEGLLSAQTGGSRLVRTVWIVDVGGDAPRLVTAYPARDRASR